MSYLMTGHINIKIILLTITTTIISGKFKTTAASNISNHKSVGNELYGDFTAIKFLMELQQHSKTTYDNILIMHNQNATISHIFYANLKDISRKHQNAATNHSSLGVLPATTYAATTFVEQLMATLQVPVLQLNELQSFNLKRHYSEHFLSIVYIDINIEGIQMTLNDHKGLLQKLSANLLHMTTSKVMFLLNFPLTLRNDSVTGTDTNDTDAVYALAALDEDVMRGVVLQLFQYCWQQKIINVVAILADYQTTRKFYSYNNFPDFELEIKSISFDREKLEQVYPYRLSNLKGYKLPIVIGGSDPRIIPYINSKGKKVLGGFVGHFVEAFAKKYNCQLIQPIPFDHKNPMPSQVLLKAVRNGTVEFSAAITFPEIPFRGYTYNYEQLNACVMVPIEPNIPRYKFFTSVFKGETYILVIAFIIVISMVLSAALYIHGYKPDLLHIICHDNCLRGLLGQSFSEITKAPRIIRFIYVQICVLGLLLTSTYNSYFSTYVTRPPKEAMLNSLDDILRTGLKVVAWQPEYNELLGRIAEYKKYAPMFHLIQDFHEYLEIRDSFNTKYGYMIPTTKWIIFQEQQKMFTTPLFRQSKNLCFFNNIPMCFPIHENSIYNSMIYRLILETAQSGLQDFWNEYGFLELITAKKLILKDLSAKEEFQAMSVNDLLYVMIFMGAMLVFVTLVFIGELLVFYRYKIKNRLKRFLRMVTRKKVKVGK